MGRHATDADRPTPELDPGYRDLTGREEGGCAGGPRTVEGAAPDCRRPSGARRCAGRWHAWSVHDVVPGACEPNPRPGGRSAGAGAARPRLRPMGRVRVAGSLRTAGTCAAEGDGDEARRQGRVRQLTAATVQPGAVAEPDPKIAASSYGAVSSSWSYRQSSGGLSGRQRRNVVACR